MPLVKIFVTCRHCNSNDLQEIGRVPVTEKHFTDHEITYRCKNCGKTTTIGVRKS
jgi:hypothetical protein